MDVRTITDEQVPDFVRALATGFFRGDYDEREAEFFRPRLDLSRTWAGFDGDRVVATLRSFAAELTLPGGTQIPSSAVTAVTVTATHRRNQLARRMVEADLAASAERGEPVAMLIASEYRIYGRYGYGPATEHATLAVDADRARFTRPGTRSGSGSVEIVDGATFRAEAPAVHEAHRARQPGAITRADHRWDVLAGIETRPGGEPSKDFLALCRDERGAATGYLRYHVDGEWVGRVSRSKLEVEDLIAVDEDSAARLWRYCCEMDLVATVKARNRSAEDRLPWLLEDPRAAQQSERADFLWVRPLDPVALLGARTYLAPGRVVIEVVDPLGHAAGTFELDGGPDGATCTATSARPQLTLPVATFGAVSLGAHSLRTLAVAGLLDVHDDRALAVADAMFRAPVAPWCATWF